MMLQEVKKERIGERIRRELSVWPRYFLTFLKSRLEYRTDFIFSLLTGIIVSASGLLFVLILMNGEAVKDLSGWTKDEVLFIFGYSMMGMAVFSLVSSNLYHFGDRYIIQGQFDRVLLRPLNSLAQVLFESFSFESVGHLFVGLFVIFSVKDALSISFGVIDYLWMVISVIAGAVILLAVFVSVASISFHFEDRVGVAPPIYNLIAFGRYPLPIFNRLIQFILSWIIPFAFVSFYPATHFFSKEGFTMYCYATPFVAVLCVFVASCFWNFGVKRYASTGS